MTDNYMTPELNCHLYYYPDNVDDHKMLTVCVCGWIWSRSSGSVG